MRNVLLVAALAGLAGCHIHEVRRPDPLTTEEILRLSREGAAPEVIIHKIWESRTIYIMDTQDVLKLHQAGVNEKVIDAMLRSQRMEREMRRHHGYCNDPWCPWCCGHIHVHGGWYW